MQWDESFVCESAAQPTHVFLPFSQHFRVRRLHQQVSRFRSLGDLIDGADRQRDHIGGSKTLLHGPFYLVLRHSFRRSANHGCYELGRGQRTRCLFVVDVLISVQYSVECTNHTIDFIRMDYLVQKSYRTIILKRIDSPVPRKPVPRIPRAQQYHKPNRKRLRDSHLFLREPAFTLVSSKSLSIRWSVSRS